MFFCVLSKEVRDLWKEAMSCGRKKSTHNLKSTSAADKYRKPKGVGNADAPKSSQMTNITTSEVLTTEKDGPSNHYTNPSESIGAEIKIDEAKNGTYGDTQEIQV